MNFRISFSAASNNFFLQGLLGISGTQMISLCIQRSNIPVLSSKKNAETEKPVPSLERKEKTHHNRTSGKFESHKSYGTMNARGLSQKGPPLRSQKSSQMQTERS